MTTKAIEQVAPLERFRLAIAAVETSKSELEAARQALQDAHKAAAVEPDLEQWRKAHDEFCLAAGYCFTSGLTDCQTRARIAGLKAAAPFFPQAAITVHESVLVEENERLRAELDHLASSIEAENECGIGVSVTLMSDMREAREALEDMSGDMNVVPQFALSKDEMFLLDWLSKEDWSSYGECHGRSFDRLQEAGLVERKPSNRSCEHEYFDLCRLTDAGCAALAKARGSQ